ncbi:Uncharacterized protein TCM_025654 [Theobroma cacao]|uniref:Reverse transcriptase zinc-binding domain-containing protein n=1 Tax=Theobroma cacao TaxID=3641 RepID=A0A061F713_THECC|nr:Uncharacterized protein TCM_025654 [Theobroma cacao]
MCMVMGNGHNVLFWQDEWIEGVILKDKFPRMFALASNKTGSVNEFGAWINGDWRWKINLRQSIFDWESAQWSGLLQMIAGITPLCRHLTCIFIILERAQWSGFLSFVQIFVLGEKDVRVVRRLMILDGG